MKPSTDYGLATGCLLILVGIFAVMAIAIAAAVMMKGGY